MNLIITCEHAGNHVPESYSHLFTDVKEVLASHRGWDPGALAIARFLATEFNAPLFSCDTTRLLIETNRSLSSHQLYSEYSKKLFEKEQEQILRQYYYPHRKGVEEVISKISKPALHLSIHTFTPVLNDIVRQVDIGILFDPDRTAELVFCKKMLDGMEQMLPRLAIKFNEPYKGTDDGFTTHLRSKFSDKEYLGVEIEVNQKFLGTENWEMISMAIKEVLLDILYDEG